MVLSQLKMLNPDCWGPGESVDTHIVGFGDKKFRGVFYPLQFSSDCLLLYKIIIKNEVQPNVFQCI